MTPFSENLETMTFSPGELGEHDTPWKPWNLFCRPTFCVKPQKCNSHTERRTTNPCSLFDCRGSFGVGMEVTTSSGEEEVFGQFDCNDNTPVLEPQVSKASPPPGHHTQWWLPSENKRKERPPEAVTQGGLRESCACRSRCHLCHIERTPPPPT